MRHRGVLIEPPCCRHSFYPLKIWRLPLAGPAHPETELALSLEKKSCIVKVHPDKPTKRINIIVACVFSLLLISFAPRGPDFFPTF